MNDDPRPALTLVVPVYNEAARWTAAPWREYLASHPASALIFVDDGSTDATPALLAEIAADPRCTVLRLERNAGKAEAVRRGIVAALETPERWVGYLDADLAAPLNEVDLLAAELARFPSLWAAIGSRVKLLGRAIDRRERRHYIGRVFATGASMALGLPVYDTQCGLKLFRPVAEVRDAFAVPFTSRWTFDVELLARLARSAERGGDDPAARIHEVPLGEWHERGGSKVRWWDGVRAMWDLVRIRGRYGAGRG